MKGNNPFEKHEMRTVSPQTKTPVIQQKKFLEAKKTVVVHQEEIAPTDTPIEAREDFTRELLSGKEYDDIWNRHDKSGKKSPQLLRQDQIDDSRFEDLFGNDWQDLKSREDRLRAARAIARREGTPLDEHRVLGQVYSFEFSKEKDERKNRILLGIATFTGAGAVLTGAETGPLGFLVGGVVFFWIGAIGIWLYSLFSGLHTVRGRGV